MKLHLIILFLTVTARVSAQKLAITPLTANAYIYTTSVLLDGSPYPANGMYVITPDGALLFDTPWDSTQFQPLADSIAIRHHKKIIYCLATHFHDDRTRGFDFYDKLGVPTWSSFATQQLCRLQQKPMAAHSFVGDTSFTIGGERFEVHYPGKGHAPDNIVIWFPKEKILYGGCFIKSTETDNIGNLSDADPITWQKSLRMLQTKYPKPQYIIPGHLGWQSRNAIKHTYQIVKRYNASHRH